MLGPEWQPITFSFGLLEAPLELVSDELSRWYGAQAVPHRLQPVRGSLSDLLPQLTPLSAPAFKRLWVRVASPRWQTAYFDGFINGGDPFPPVSYLAQSLGRHGVAVTSQPDSERLFGANKLEIYGPQPTEWLNLVWCVAAVNDGGRWVWQRFGPEQSFEETTAYARRKVKERLTPDRLQRYCKALAIPLEPAAYGPDAVLDVPANIARPQRQESLADARTRCGIA